jgi:UDP-N-acetylglucosamine 2-epimerase (non-hydrolysing)
MLTVLSVIGTRPEAIKMAPVIRELEKRADRVRSILCVTGQHREMLDQVLDIFSIHPDIDLDLMAPDQSLSALTANLFSALDPVVAEARPDWVLAQGDTTTVLVASLVAFYRRVRFGHVEAGLRTGNRDQPFPEEVNRRIADIVADLHFAPTARCRAALLAEGTPEACIHVTGNTVIDALLAVVDQPYDWSAGPLAGLPAAERLVLVTAHRRESFGAPLRDICLALRDLAGGFADGEARLVYPVHLNPNVRRPVYELLGGLPNVSLIEPLGYRDMAQLMRRAALILTDSGGIQEEAPSLGVPVLVMRDATERPEGIEAGVVRLVGTHRERVVSEAERILRDPAAHAAMATRVNPYGDGRAASRIASILLEETA